MYKTSIIFGSFCLCLKKNLQAKTKRCKRLLLIFSLLITAIPLQAQDYFKQGCVEQDKGHLDQAIQYYNKKLDQEPNFTKAYINRGLCYQDKGDFDLALNDFKKALELSPGNPAINMSMGTAYFHLKKFPEALKCLETALQVEPNNANGQYDLGMTLHELKDYAGAVKAFNTAIRIDPDKERFYYSRGLSKDQLRDYQGAMNDFSEAIRLKPDYEKAYYLRAKEENTLQLYREAIADINKVLKINPANTRYYAEKADLEYHLGWLSKGFEDSKTAITLNDQYGAPFYTKAMIERDSGLLDSAAADMAKANDLFRGKSSLVWYESGLIQIYAGNYDNAFKDFNNALKITPDYLYCLIMCGNIKFYSKDAASAIAFFEHVIQKDSNAERAYYLLGRTQLILLHNAEGAKKYFEKAIQLNNDSQVTAYCYAFLGNTSEVEHILNNRLMKFEHNGLRIKTRENYADFSFCYAVLKNADKSLKFLDEALDEGYSFKSWIEDSPEFDYLRNRTEYQLLKIKYKLKK
jgi:tetratricopeptide (TPR) repeat protein